MFVGIADDVLTLWDFALRRLTRFRTDGSLIDVSPVPIQERRILKCDITPEDETGEMVPTTWRLIPSAEGFIYP